MMFRKILKFTEVYRSLYILCARKLVFFLGAYAEAHTDIFAFFFRL